MVGAEAAAVTTKATRMVAVARAAPMVQVVPTKDPVAASIIRVAAIMEAVSTMADMAEATAATRVAAGQEIRIICRVTDSTRTRVIRTTADNTSKTWAAAVLRDPRR